MNSNNNEKEQFLREILTVEGQILKILSEKERMAGEIYAFVNASQSTISRKIARMVDQGMIECRISAIDRRVPIYCISESYRRFLQESEIISLLGPSVSSRST